MYFRRNATFCHATRASKLVSVMPDYHNPFALPRISVLLPVYNGERFLAETLRSVLDQTFRDIEIVAVDDGSTDSTAALLQAAARADERIRVIAKPNSGISETLNVALQHARSPLVARIDADDLMEPDRLRRQMDFLAAHPEIAGTGSYYTLINEAGEARGEIRPLPGSVEELHRYLAGGGQLRYTHPTLLFRRDAALSAGGYRRAFEPCEDVDLFLRMAEAGDYIIIQPEFLTRYRVHGGSISSRSAARQHVMLSLVYANYDARRHGRPERDLTTFEQEMAREPFWQRVRDRGAFWSEMLYRRHTKALMEDRKLVARLNLLAAAAFKPRRALGRAWRVVRRQIG